MPDEHGQRLMAWSAYSPGGKPQVSQPVQADLRQTAITFGAQVAIFRSIMSAGGPTSVDGGDPDLDRALTLILELSGGLNAQLATTIAEYGRGLQQACESAQERS